MFMKYYLDSKNENDMNTYITSVKEDANDGFYHVTYANGVCEDNVALTKENREIIEKKLTTQIEDGLNNRYKIRRKQIKGFIGRIGATTASSGIFYGVTSNLSDDLKTVAIGAGMICIGGVLRGIKKYKSDQQALDEIDCYKVRKKYSQEVQDYLKNSSNVNRCLGDERFMHISHMISQDRDPLSLVEIENGGITNEEFYDIIQSSRREKELGLQYVRK